jgi:hypothetical protein
MIPFWVLMSFWIGVMTGFGVFALMQVSREGADKADREVLPMMSAGSPNRRQQGTPSSRTKDYSVLAPRCVAGRHL